MAKLKYLKAVGEFLCRVIRLTKQKRSASKARHAQKDFAEQILHNMGQGLTVLKPDFTIEYANLAFLRMTGYSLEEIIQTNLFNLSPSIIQPEDEGVIHRSLSHESTSYEG